MYTRYQLYLSCIDGHARLSKASSNFKRTVEIADKVFVNGLSKRPRISLSSNDVTVSRDGGPCASSKSSAILTTVAVANCGNIFRTSDELDDEELELNI